ncbi:MAG TPA: hypothetical protein VGQ57_17955 [Polyangiaceae bacterium]|nr:hypothetical protein [Polyangiaceae bacterium]
MSSSRYAGRVERQQGYAAARAVQSLARKLRGRKLTTKEARALTVLAGTAASGSARSAKAVTSGGKYKSRKRRRSAIRRDTYGYVRGVTGERKGRRKKGRKSSRRKAVMYGPVPFQKQSKKTRKYYLKTWKAKGYRRVRRYSR